MPKIRACQKELVKAFGRHSKLHAALDINQVGSAPANMVLFYAVECGLKACYLEYNRLPPTAALPPSMYSHDLADVLKDLRVPASMVSGRLITFRAKSDRAKIYPCSEIHLAWRYGVDVLHEDEDVLLTDLKHLQTYAKGVLT
jgi:hypothetical protein